MIVIGVPVIKVNAQDISNTPSEWLLGTISANSIHQQDFTVTNNGENPVNITISGSNMTGGIPWTLSPTAEPDTDTYGLIAGLDGGSFDIIVNGNGIPLVENLSSGNTTHWGLQLLAPTSFADGVLKSGTVTLTATEA